MESAVAGDEGAGTAEEGEGNDKTAEAEATTASQQNWETKPKDSKE
jgi:hypothetical protein